MSNGKKLPKQKPSNLNNQHFGIYSTMSKKFVFGIDEPTKKQASNALFRKIGKDAYKWRFEVKPLPRELWKDKIR